MTIGRVTRVAGVVLVAFATALAGVPSAGAEPGDLDATFGTCGVKLRSVPGAPEHSTLGATVAQADGKLLQVLMTPDDMIQVTRLSASGTTVDPSYGNNGTTRIGVPGLSGVRGAVVGPNGKLVVLAFFQSVTRLVRLNASGSRDQGFGTGGVLALDRFPPAGILVQSDNRIIFWGGPEAPQRYNPNGTVNATWTPVIPPAEGRVVAATLAPDGDFVAAVGSTPTFVHRFEPSGAEVAGFPTSYTFPAPGTASEVDYDAQQLIAFADGSLLVPGRLLFHDPPGSVHQFVTATKLDAVGVPVAGYGTAGHLRIPVPGHPTITAARTDGTGRLLVSGKLGADEAPFVLARITPTGAPDAGFGTGGTAIVNVGFFPAVTGLVLRGRWIIVGLSVNLLSGANRQALVRFRDDSTTAGAAYLVDQDAGLHPLRMGTDSPPPCVLDGPALAGLARSVTTVKNRGGLVLDGYGGLHRFSIGVRRAPAEPKAGPYWPGFDIARGVAALPNGKGGYVLDGFGGIHRYRTGANPLPPPAVGGPYWPGWDIARGIALLPNGTGGYVVDGFAGIHPFAVGGNPMPPPTTFHFPAFHDDVARGIAILPDGTGGYLITGLGDRAPFGIGTPTTPPFWFGPPVFTPVFRGLAFVAPRAGAG